jgi:hypothetical protein
VVRLWQEIPAVFGLNRLKLVAPVKYPLRAFSARPDLVPDGTLRSLLIVPRMSQEDGRPRRCVAAPGCNPGASARACPHFGEREEYLHVQVLIAQPSVKEIRYSRSPPASPAG